MDNILAQEIDTMLQFKLPSKSSVSGANYIAAYAQNTGDLDLVNSNLYRFSLPKIPTGYLARTKGGLGPFFTYTLVNPGGGAQIAGNPWAVISQYRVLLNGVEISNSQQGYQHFYAEWLKKKSTDYLTTDAQNACVNYDGGFKDFVGEVDTNVKVVLPLPDNTDLLTNKTNALPLEMLDIVVEVYLNNKDNCLYNGVGGNNLASCKISDLRLYLPIVNVDPEVDQAIKMRLTEGDVSDEAMIILPVEDVKVDRQSYNWTGSGTKTFVFNNVSSSVRLLEAKISQDPTTGVQRVPTGLNPGIQSFNFVVDGKKAIQNDVTTSTGAGPDLSYSLYKDLVSTYNFINSNEEYKMGVIGKYTYDNVAVSNQVFGDIDDPLNASFVIPQNLDTVSKDFMVGGKKVINQLNLEINYNTANPANNTNLYLIEYSNKLIAFSKSKCKVLK